jgi:hypothetical protein
MMNRSTPLARTLLVIAAGWLIASCLQGPADDTESASQAITFDGNGPPPPTCDTTPSCSLTFAGGYTTVLQSQLGCLQNLRYMSGANSGFLGGILSSCPDTPANRSALRAAGYRAFLPGYCNTCIGVPAGRLYVFWTEFLGPGCPSSCTTSPTPSQL